MKAWATNQTLWVIEATDEYFNDAHNAWYPVPKFWIGDFVTQHSYRIRSRQ